MIITLDPNHVTDYGPCPADHAHQSALYLGKLITGEEIEAFFEWGDFPPMEPTPATDEVTQ